jgi:mannitol/fructose-specific phosphotransferase system IIA component (Ntr-type)
VVDFPGFYQELLAREQIETTCVNEIAFPHARTDHVKSMVLSVGRSKKGVWFENAGQMVKLIFVIGTPKRMVTEYLSVVGGLARLLKDKEIREQLLEASTPAEFVDVIARGENR